MRFEEGTSHANRGLDAVPEIDLFPPRRSKLGEFREILEEVLDALPFSVGLGKFRQAFRVFGAAGEDAHRESQARQRVPHLPRDDHCELSDGGEAFQFCDLHSKPSKFLLGGPEPMARASLPRRGARRLPTWRMSTRHRRSTGRPAYGALIAPDGGGTAKGRPSTRSSIREPERPHRTS